MALDNVYSGTYLMARTHTGNATSEVVAQELVDTDFTTVKNARIIWQLNNISSPTSSADTLITGVPVSIGSRLVIRKNDGSFHEMIVSATTPVTNAGQIPAMWGNTTPAGTAYSVNTSYPAYNMFDKTSSTQTYIAYGSPATEYVSYRNHNDIPSTHTEYFLHSSANGWTLQGSTNGLDWVDLDVRTGTANGVYAITQNQGAYVFYKIKTGDNYSYCYRWDLLGAGVSIDTSAITASETPDQVYLFDDVVTFNDQPLVENFVNFDYGQTGLRARAWTQYNDLTLPDDGQGSNGGARSITTAVQFSSAGNLITELTSDLWKAPEPTPPFSVSKATAVDNAVTVYFPSDIDIVGDVLLSCTISINSGVPITPDTATPNTNFIVFNIPAASIAIGDTVDFIYDSTIVGSDILEAGTSNELSTGTYPAINTIV